jgi:hypothetical protein
MQNAILRKFSVAVALLCVSSIAHAQDTVRLRGTVERIDGPI